jgi:beta-glucosidase
MLIDSIPVGCPQFSIGQSSYWLETPTEPLFPFGYGLSYTTFRYNNIEVLPVEGQANHYTVSCCITNTGDRDASETVQLYTRQLSGDLVRPIRELKGFEKIHIPAGESRTVRFTLTPEQLAYWHEQKDNCESRVWLATDTALFQVWIAPDSRCATVPDTLRINL